MPTNDFLPFGTAGGANVLSQAAWAALAARTAGFSSGIAKSEELNKAWRQSSFIAAALAQAISDLQAVDVLDDGDLAALTAKVKRMAGAAFTSLTGSTTLTAAQMGLIYVSAAGGNVVLTMPAAAAGGATVPLRVTIVRTDTSVNTVNLVRGGSDTLNGLTGNCLLPVGASVTLLSDGVSAWRLVGSAGLSQIDRFVASGTATAPWWARLARKVQVWGGGGGGGGALNGLCAATGGSGGGYSEKANVVVTPGGTFAVTIGAAGTAGVAGGGNAGAGGNTSFGSVCSATGGGGGFGSSGGITGTTATPGSGSGGDINLNGGIGSAGFITGNTSLYAGGAGAPAPFGYLSTLFTIAAGGLAGAFPGGSGGGASENAAGGAGAAGYAIVEWSP